MSTAVTLVAVEGTAVAAVVVVVVVVAVVVVADGVRGVLDQDTDTNWITITLRKFLCGNCIIDDALFGLCWSLVNIMYGFIFM